MSEQTQTDTPAKWYYARDGHKTGPVDFEALREAIATGGLRAGDLVWTAGMPQWSAAAAVPALAGEFGGAASALPPLPPPLALYPPGATAYGQFGAPLAYAGPLPVQPGTGPDAGMRWLLPVGRSGWAIAAGYLGLLSVLGCTAPIALVISIIAVRDLRRHPHLHGMGRAIFGLVMGGLGTLALVWILGRRFLYL